ncbi:polysaccharide deacetylase family protein [Treponema sp. OMZ 840]|uniref:polysaccharide deacetylase family protein n=1 Tax=Treponema sp. OMZ 840 TaxID=244313 RepID=UPI003D8C27F1
MNKKNKIFLPLFLCLFFLVLVHMPYCAYAQVSFADIDLNNDDGLLFSTRIKQGTLSWNNLYSAKLNPNKHEPKAIRDEPKLLTCFPQKLDSLQSGKFLQIRNADGVFMYGFAAQTLTCLSSTPSLYPHPSLKARIRDNLMETAVSPDGNWICLFRKKNAVSGSIVLSSTQTGKELVLVEQTDFSFTDIPVLWSPDSEILIYEKENKLYFIQPKNAFDPALADEKFRTVGEGNISCVHWIGQKKLVYIQGYLIFSLFSHELYTRALYSAVLGTGKIIGRLPWYFNGREDTFWADETGKRFVIIQAHKNIFYFDIEKGINVYNSAFLPVSDAASAFYVFWTPHSAVTPHTVRSEAKTLPVVWVEYFAPDGTQKSAVYALQPPRKTSDSEIPARFADLQIPPAALKPALSPDKKRIAFCADGVLHVYSLDTWKAEFAYADERVISFAWRNSSSLYVGGEETVRLWNCSDGTKKVLFLSSADKFSWNENGDSIFASVSAGTFRYNEDTHTWIAEAQANMRKKQTMNRKWRILFEQKTSAFYDNVIIVRSLQGPSRNLPLLTRFYDIKPQKGNIALAFDALDRAESLPYILNTLSARGLSATFFINGEFMRRFPDSVAAIDTRGHECASMFHTSVDLLSDDFIVDENFIRRGLAKNEDEFFELTGKDLKLFWHTPYCRFSPLIEQAGKNAGYTLIERIICTYCEKDRLQGSGQNFFFSAQHISDICTQLSEGTVILFPCGLAESWRSASLCDTLEILINAILEAGYNIVPVSKLVY